MIRVDPEHGDGKRSEVDLIFSGSSVVCKFDNPFPADEHSN